MAQQPDHYTVHIFEKPTLDKPQTIEAYTFIQDIHPLIQTMLSKILKFLEYDLDQPLHNLLNHEDLTHMSDACTKALELQKQATERIAALSQLTTGFNLTAKWKRLMILKKLIDLESSLEQVIEKLTEGAVAMQRNPIDETKDHISQIESNLKEIIPQLDFIESVCDLIKEKIVRIHCHLKLNSNPNYVIEPKQSIARFQKVGKPYTYYPVTMDMQNPLSQVQEGAIIDVVGGHGSMGLHTISNTSYQNSQFITKDQIEILTARQVVQRLIQKGLPKDQVYVFKLRSCYSGAPSSDKTIPSFAELFHNQLLLQGFIEGSKIIGSTAITIAYRSIFEPNKKDQHKQAFAADHTLIGRASQFCTTVSPSPEVAEKLKTRTRPRR